jgi:hypothetical protein
MYLLTLSLPIISFLQYSYYLGEINCNKLFIKTPLRKNYSPFGQKYYESYLVLIRMVRFLFWSN